MISQAKTLAAMLDKTRQLNLFFLDKLKEQNPLQEIELGGISFNSIYWIWAHIAWAEYSLVLRITGANFPKKDWFDFVKLGSSGKLPAEKPDFETIKKEAAEIHTAAIAHIESLTDEYLELPNSANFSFGDGDNSNRLCIQHAIRHEGNHGGQLLWLCKIHGIKVI